MFKRIVLTDVCYQSEYAQAAGVVIQSWSDTTPASEYLSCSYEIEEYVSGQFYQRELPHLLTLLQKIENYDCVVVDAHVWLKADQPGAGHYLWRALGEHIPVIGVAKNSFHGGIALSLTRGDSKKPLWISAVGIDPQKAHGWIKEMAGPYRVPTLLKHVDALSRLPPDAPKLSQ
jgi:deoxyribonuclease V